jgi:hypothetical protein
MSTAPEIWVIDDDSDEARLQQVIEPRLEAQAQITTQGDRNTGLNHTKSLVSVQQARDREDGNKDGDEEDRRPQQDQRRVAQSLRERGTW